MTATHPLAPALHIVDAVPSRVTDTEATTSTFVLSGWDDTTSAATEPWALLELTGPDRAGHWSHHIHPLGAVDTGGWEERLRALSEAGLEVGPGVARYWQETANGVVWEITELEPTALINIGRPPIDAHG